MLGAMLIQTAESFFGGCAGIARALAPRRTVSAVYQWKKKGVVPLAAAQQLAALSGGELTVDTDLYDQYGNIVKNPKHKKRA
jgi:hypothetical protein